LAASQFRPELLDDTLARDGLTDHWRKSYVCETGKSMKTDGIDGVSSLLLAKNLRYTHNQGQRVKWPVAVEKGTKAVISANFSACCKGTINNLQTSFGR
jgi:hypothetical protein